MPTPPIRRLNIKAAAQRAAPAPTPPPRRAVVRPAVTAQPITRHTQVSLRAAGNAEPLDEGHENETLGTVRVATGQQARVRFGAGLTINLGNFESARIDVQVELPCDADNITAALEEATEFVHTRLAEEEARWNTPRN